MNQTSLGVFFFFYRRKTKMDDGESEFKNGKITNQVGKMKKENNKEKGWIHVEE